MEVGTKVALSGTSWTSTAPGWLSEDDGCWVLGL